MLLEADREANTGLHSSAKGQRDRHTDNITNRDRTRQV